MNAAPLHPTYYYNTPYPFFPPVPVALQQPNAPSPASTSTQYSASPSPPQDFVQNHQAYQTPYPAIATPRLSKPRSSKSAASSKQIQIAHPYARLLAKKDEVKRRKIWNHALEKFIFSAYEL
jgi:hypothetical protein